MAQIPKTFSKLQVVRLTQKFRDAVQKVSIQTPVPKANSVLIRNRYVGINASDINFTSGRYTNMKMELPSDCGFEAVGEVVAAGSNSPYKVGQAVGYMTNGAFSEYIEVPAKMTFPMPAVKPEYVPLILSGTTAAISLDRVGEMKKGETVLVTAAAGGTGQFAVQLAKLAGCHVIGTCSTDEKVELLKKLGCDRAINYKKENLDHVLKTEYKKGVDVVYESVGGATYDTCVKSLAVKGRLVVIGYISGYENDRGFVPSKLTTLPQHLLPKSASVRGFFLFHNFDVLPEYLLKLVNLVSAGKLQVVVDKGESSQKGPFVGVDSIVDAVEHLYTGKSKGKIIVEFPEAPTSKL